MYVNVLLSVLEEQKAGVEKEASDLRSSLRDVEKARLDGRRELQDLRRQLKMIDAERVKLIQELGELQTRCAREEERGEEMKKEIFDLRQKVYAQTRSTLAATKGVLYMGNHGPRK